ncbi:5'/3'-nucleotidase SurE [Blastococcus sp. SYSU D00813]
MRRTVPARCAATVLVAATTVLGGCTSVVDGRATPSAAAPGTLNVLLANDDGIANPAIDVLLALLLEQPGIEVTVVAPDRQRSGSSDALTDGELTYQRARTPAGVLGWSQDGYPGDAVVVALDGLHLDPDLVVSGINPGPNVGPFAAESGTVGIGRTAIRRGVPALAVSAGAELDPEQFAFAAGLALDWITAHRDALLAGTEQTDTVTSINVPACPVAAMGELLVTELADRFPAGADPFTSDCDLADPAPDDDYEALVAGYPSVAQVPADL